MAAGSTEPAFSARKTIQKTVGRWISTRVNLRTWELNSKQNSQSPTTSDPMPMNYVIGRNSLTWFGLALGVIIDDIFTFYIYHALKLQTLIMIESHFTADYVIDSRLQ